MVQAEVLRRVFRIIFNNSSGTAFTIERKGVQFLVTAKHIFVSGGFPAAGSIRLLIQGQYKPFNVEIRYPEDNEIDIAVMKVTPYQLLSPVFNNEPTTEGMVLGQDVYFLGFPYDYDLWLDTLAGDVKPIPFVKKACLSTITMKNRAVLLLDGHNNPGFSGGPVCYKKVGSSDTAMHIAGVISGYRFDNQPLYDKFGAPTEFYTHDNTGIIVSYCINHANEIADNWA